MQFRSLVFFILAAFAVACSSDKAKPHVDADAGPQGPTGASPEVVACGRGEPCPTGKVCDAYRGCVECLFDDQCGPGKRCLDRKCETAVSCNATTTCKAPDKVCDLASGRCVACLNDSDCPSGNHCEERVCKKFDTCVNSFDCKDGKVCDRQKGECVGCVTTGDCALGTVCANSKCERSCDGDSDCLELNQLCDREHLRCAACITDRDCPKTHHCDEGTCKVDVCVEGTTRCVSSDSYVTCLGAQAIQQSCGFSNLCIDKAGSDFPCVSQICTPNEVFCDVLGTKVMKCSADGLSQSSVGDCAADQTCVSGVCLNTVCTPGARYCDGTSIATCNFNGTGSESKSPCGDPYTCDPTSVTCVFSTCTAGAVKCLDGVPATCKDGLTYIKGDACAKGKVCSAGACVDTVCEPKTVSCGGGNVVRCGDDGQGTSISETCFSGSVCVEENGTASCKVKSCTPGVPVCDNGKIATCNATGTGAEGAKDCPANNVCSGTSCQPIVCKNTRFCQDNNVYSCMNQGTSTQLYDACNSNENCTVNIDDAYCAAQICTPGAAACNGNTVTKCNAKGSGYESGGTPCAANTACLNATCLPVVCPTPGQTYCQGGNVYTCGEKGVSSSLAQTCQASQYCSSQGTYATCAYDVCTAGSPICRDNFATTCATDGSGPLATGGTNCTTTSKVCDTGACLPVVCDKNEKFCKAGNVETCNATGTASYTSTTCSSETYCKDTGTNATCEADICTPTVLSCNGEKPAVCDATGGGFQASTTTCSATQVCNQAGACALSAADLVGDENPGYSNADAGLILDKLIVRTSRKLTQLELNISTSGTTVLTWVIYEGAQTDNGQTAMTKIFEKTTSATGVAYVGTGAISVPLKAGNRYLIGAMSSTALTVGSAGSVIYDNLSFGQVTGAMTYSITTLPASMSWDYTYTTFYPFQERLTTTVP